MDGAELLLVVVGAIAVTALARRWNLQAPLVLVVLGLLVSLIPGIPRLEIEPEIILSLVLPPLLYATAVEFSVINFIRNLWPILGLGVVLVAITAGVVGVTGNWLVPELTLASALVLGSVVGPPDAVTAVAVGRKLGLPRRVMTILTGESLVNDAAALTLFTITTVAVTGETAFISSPVLFFGYGVLVGIVVGRVLAWIVQLVQRRLNDPGLQTVLGLVLPFACYLVAEELHASGVIAVITAGFAIGHAAGRTGYAARIQERDVWHSIEVLLEAFVFAYIGLQMKFVFVEVIESDESLPAVLLSSLVLLLVVLAVRPAYVLGRHGLQVLAQRFVGWRRRRDPERYRLAEERRERFRAEQQRRRGAPAAEGPKREHPILPLKQDLVISWTGMRGVVTLAAAAGIPLTTAAGDPFPGRSMIQVAAFVIAVGTLLLQGTTLPPFIRRLRIEPDDPGHEQAQLAHAQATTQQAAQEVMERAMDRAGQDIDPQRLERISTQLRRFQEQRQRLMQATEDEQVAEDDPGRHPHDDLRDFYGRLRLEILEAQRRALTRERDAFRLEDDTYRELLEQLDYDQAATSSRASGRLP